MKFTQLAKSLREGIAPIYLIEGEETFFRDHAVEYIRDACAISQPVLNDVRYEGENLKGDKLSAFRDELYTLPFFDEKRIARVYEFYPTEKEWEQVLKGYCEKPSLSTVLVIVNGGKKANTADLKRKSGILYIDCGRGDEEELSRWLFALMRRMNLIIDAETASLMVRFCARDAARMKKETEKLLLLLGEGGKVTREIVEEYVAKDTEYFIYELTQAASRKNAAAFYEILDELLKKGFDENAVLSSLTSHFRTLLEVGRMKGSDAQIAKTLNMKPYPVQKNRETYRRLGGQKTEEYYLALYALSSGAKSGVYTKSGALFAATAKIFFG